jgi:hypothetical protein
MAVVTCQIGQIAISVVLVDIAICIEGAWDVFKYFSKHNILTSENILHIRFTDGAKFVLSFHKKKFETKKINIIFDISHTLNGLNFEREKIWNF